MGLIIFGAFFVCGALALISGAVASFFAARRGQRAWLVFTGGALVAAGACALAAFGVAKAVPTHSGAPTGDDYVSALLIACAVGVSIGLAITGVASGCGVVIRRLFVPRSRVQG